MRDSPSTPPLSALTANRLIATHRARCWCRALAACAFIALALPSLGPVSWLLSPHVTRAHAAQRHQADSEHANEHGYVDASAIPGSPTHPADHDCAECQVLKHLSRCILAVPAIDFAVSPPAALAAQPIGVRLPEIQDPALLPPVRAPPASLA